MANTTYDTIKNMKPAPWSRSTVADGNALNQNFLEPTHQKDLTLADAIDQVRNTVDGYNEIINNISNVADTAKSQAANAISAANEAQNDVEALQTTVTNMSTAVTQHGNAIETLDNNFNTLSATVAGEAEAISNLQNNKQDKIYVDANTISGNGTENSPYTVIGGNQKELEFVDSTTVTVHKDEQDDKIIYSFSAAGGGGGGTSYDMAWYPTVDTVGNIAWEWNRTTTAPTATNIKGPQGERGPTGPQGISGNKGNDATPITATTAAIAGGTQVTISYTSGGDPLAQFNVLSGAQGASGANGFSPTVATATTAADDKTGTKITFTYVNSEGTQQTESYIAWNGIDGQGATVNLLEGDGIQITHAAGTTNYTIGVSADYATKTYVDGQVGNKVDKPTSAQTGKLVYDTETSAWSNIGLDGYVPYSARTLAIGYKNSVAFCDFAQGNTNYANTHSISQGEANSAKDYSFAQGHSNSANDHSFAQGESNTATETAFAQGKSNYSYTNAMSQGFSNSADDISFAQGKTNYAYNNAISQGEDNYAQNYALAQGRNTSAISHSFAQGYDNYAYDNALSQGQDNYAENAAFAEGVSNSAYYSSFTQGNSNSASYQGLAQGIRNYAHGNGFAQGFENIAQNHSFAQGHTCTAIGESFAQGFDCYAENHSQAVGLNTSASYYMMAIGQYNNVMNKNNENAAFVIGNGNANDDVITRSDAFIVYQDGHVSAAGDIWANGVKLGAGGGTVYDIIGNNGISAKKDTANNRYEVGLSANVTSQLSKIDSKSTVTSGAGNVFTVNDTTSNPAKNFTFSAVNYKAGQTAGYLPQQLFVVASDNEIISLVNGGAADDKGCLFFRVQ